jgi:GNAT superfamily N-acetyltransferase
MSVRIVPVATRGDLRRFIYLPEALHRDHARWMPPIYWDEWQWFNPKKNLAFRYCDSTLALAWRDGRPVGRVMGIINRRHNEKMNERNVRFSCLECPEDRDVCHALLAHVEEWGRAQGMTKIVGPLGFNDQDPEGFQIEGFEHAPTIVTYYNFPFIPQFLEAEGYAKEVDYFVYHVPVMDEVPSLIAKVAERVERRGFREVGLKNKREARRYILPVLGLMNETFVGVYGYSPLDDQEMRALADKFVPLLDVRFVKVVEKDGEVVGFMIGIPNLYEGIVKARGRLFPFGFIHILRAGKRTKQLDLLLGGIKEEHRGRGVDMLMGREILRSARAAGFTVFDTHHELESNTLVRAEMERWGAKLVKKYRVYHKML